MLKIPNLSFLTVNNFIYGTSINDHCLNLNDEYRNTKRRIFSLSHFSVPLFLRFYCYYFYFFLVFFLFQGYSMAKLFIATQAPLPQTIPAFWRLVWEHQCKTIVCLAQETENGKVSHIFCL